MRLLLTALLANSVGFTGLIASETQPVDLRIAVLLLPPTERVETSTVYYAGGGSDTTGDELNFGYRVELGLVTPLVQFPPSLAVVGGVWAFYGDQKSDSNGSNVGMNSTTLGIDFYVALQAQLNEILSIQFGPVVGLGNMRFSNQVGGTEKVGHGDYQEAGLNLEISLRDPQHRTSFGLGLRYFGSYGEADIHADGARQNNEVSQTGFAPYAKLGVRF